LFIVTIRILIADDHPLVRVGLRALIGTEPDMELVGEACDGDGAVTLHAQLTPDVVLMDLRMPRMDGITAIRAIRAASPSARIVALTTYEGDADIYHALEAGACGYLIKDTLGREVIAAISAASKGDRIIPAGVAARLAEFTPRDDLTVREVEVLRFAARGMRNKDIARRIGRTAETVKAHLRHLMAKLGAADRTEAVTLALKRGIIHPDD
jgi:DNA-binding NarL/FixJ family response regulator